MDRDDVGMVERRGRAHLLLEPLAAFRIRRQRGRQNLDRDVALQPRVACAIHFAHRAGADGGEDLIRPDAASGCESHCYLVGTRRFSSSVQCWTTIRLAGAAVWSEPPASLIIRNRWPS